MKFSGRLGHELACVVQAWEKLPEHVRQSIATLAEANTPR